MTPVLRVEQLKIDPLPPLTFEVADGECLGIEGPSGSGKSRLLRAIADLDPAPGHIRVDGSERSETPGPDWRRTVRYAAAEPAWWTETAGAGIRVSGKSERARRDRLVSALGLDPALLDRPIALLSTGERQRLALIRALADDPKVLLLDEPTGALDPVNTGLVEELIRFLLLSGRIVLIASHDERQLARLAQRRLQLARSTVGHGLGSTSGASASTSSGSRP